MDKMYRYTQKGWVEVIEKTSLGSKNIIVNGLYNAEQDNLVGYNSVNVNIPDMTEPNVVDALSNSY